MEETRGLSEENQKYCRNYLKESDEKKIECLEFLENYLDEHPELNAKRDEYNLVRFLRACKYDKERAIKKLNCFYTLRGTTPEWFSNRDPRLPELQDLLKIGVFLPLLKCDPEGRYVIIIRIAAHNPNLHGQNNVFKVFIKVGMMTLDLLLDKLEETSVHGVRAIFDMNGVTIGHARQLTVSMIKKLVHSWQDCYPVRVRSLDFVNSPSYINVVLDIFRRFMKEKIRNRVHVHGWNRESLHNIIPPDILPEEYGGTDQKLEHLISHWRNVVTESAEWYAEDEKYKLTT